MIIEDVNDTDVLYLHLNHFLKEDKAAIDFIIKLFCIFHIWDDMVDKDKELTVAQINETFITLMIELPDNPFYARFGHVLRPVMMNCILSWQSANVLERSEVMQEKRIAFVDRASIINIITYCALLIGGKEWACKIAPDIKRMYQEDWDKYLKEFEKQEA